ncbi:hypothetical protein BT69DRAFT_1294495 [Atractiella rhizophila]|nr:hypothetical protein BT69DRAFT_1294495 [Atractiella rhizophila]
MGSRPHVKIPDADLYLLKSLASLDARTIYVTYGQNALLNCAPPVGWCRPPNREYAFDYFLYDLPELGVDYLITLCAVAIMTSGEMGRRLRWRKWLTFATLAMGTFEIWRFLSATGSIDSRGRMEQVYSTNIFYRRLFLSALPAFAYFLPIQPPLPPGPNTLLSRLLSNLSYQHAALTTELKSYDLQRSVLYAMPEYGQRVANGWREEEREREEAKSDEEVLEGLKRLELHDKRRENGGEAAGEEGKERTSVRKHVETLWDDALARLRRPDPPAEPSSN